MKSRIWRFCLLAIIMMAIVQVIGCTGTMVPGATPAVNGVSSPTAAADTALSSPSVSAMEGYRLAKKAALAWNKDAVLVSIVGATMPGPNGENATVDGKTTFWMYDFKSLSAAAEFAVYVTNGSISNNMSIAVDKKANPDWINNYTGMHPDSDWKVDTTQAVDTALRLYRAEHDTDPASAMYILLNNGKDNSGRPNYYWMINLNPPDTTYYVGGTRVTGCTPFHVYIDPTSGAVLPNPTNSTQK